MKKYDVAIIGAGIAGASIASEIGAHRSVLLLEAEAAGDLGTSQGKPVPLPETARWKNVISAELRRQKGQ